jgi:hypothetical protein
MSVYGNAYAEGYFDTWQLSPLKEHRYEKLEAYSNSLHTCVGDLSRSLMCILFGHLTTLSISRPCGVRCIMTTNMWKSILKELVLS